MKGLFCPKCNDNNKLDKEEIPNNMDLIFFNCSNCHYKIATSTILNESISRGNKTYKDTLMNLLKKTMIKHCLQQMIQLKINENLLILDGR